GAELEMIRPPVGIDDEVGGELWACRLDQDMDLLGVGASALGIANDPAHGIADRNGTGARELLAFLQRDISDLPRGSVDLVERTVGEGIDLHRVNVAAPCRLYAGRGIGEVHALLWIPGLQNRPLWRQGLELAWQRQRLRHFDYLHGLG